MARKTNRFITQAFFVSITTACSVEGEDALGHDVQSGVGGKSDVVDDDTSTDAPGGPAPADLIVHGEGLQEWQNAVVHGRLGYFWETDTPISTTPLVDGSFTLNFPGQLDPFSFGTFLRVHIDVNGNGDCDARDVVVHTFINAGWQHVNVETAIDFSDPDSRVTFTHWCEDFEGFVPPETSLDCAETCANVPQGSCADSWCEGFCDEHVQSQSEALQDAFVQCIEQDPLCFTAPQDCVHDVLSQE